VPPLHRVDAALITRAEMQKQARERLEPVTLSYERESTKRSASRDEGQQTPMGNAAGCASSFSAMRAAELRRASRDAGKST